MSDDFRQTVNLRAKVEAEEAARREAMLPKAKKEEPKKKQRQKKRSQEIDKMYNGDQDDKITKKELSQITRPIFISGQETLYKRIVIGLGAILIILIGYWLFIRPHDVPDNSALVNDPVWYSIELVDGEKYYGQVLDKEANPVTIKNVYYNYDQLNKETGGEEAPKETGNLRLVKRGKETHGPSGEMSIYQAQIKFMEPLDKESKVLKAILEYEK